jgi:hypothetical protein
MTNVCFLLEYSMTIYYKKHWLIVKNYLNHPRSYYEFKNFVIIIVMVYFQASHR